MSWDGVPWAIGGGQAEHSANIARNVAFAAFGGREGIVGAADLEVRELAVAGSSVRVFPGTVAVKNRATGVRDEMYVGRLPTQDVVPVAPTSTAARSDLVAVVVKDPYLAGSPWNVPALPNLGPYIETVIISDVPSTTTDLASLGLGYSGVALARIDLPTNTGTITQNMIVDLRDLSQQQMMRSLNITAPAAQQTLTQTSYVNWPSEANVLIDVPAWATHAKVFATLTGVAAGQAGTNGGAGWAANGDLRVRIGSGGNIAYGQATRYNLEVASGVARSTVIAGAPLLAIPAALQGQKQVQLRIEGRKIGGSTNIFTDDKSMVAIDTEFVNRAVSNIVV